MTAQKLTNSLKLITKNHSVKLKTFALLAIAISFSLLAINYRSTNAQSTSRTFTISPITLQATLKPGGKTETQIKITNNSDQTLYFDANINDFVVTNNEGTPEILPIGQTLNNKYSAASWMTVQPDSFSIAPGQSYKTNLYIQVPGNARPGGRYVAVTFRPLTIKGDIQSGAFINTIVGTPLVYLTVEGEVKEDAKITLFDVPKFSEYGPIAFKTVIKNLSDIHVSPRATIKVKNIFGKESFSTSIGDKNIFPGTSITYNNSWEKKWLFGRYTAQLSGYYGQKNLPLLVSTSFWVIPYKLVITIILAIAIVFISYKYFNKKTQPEEVEEENTPSTKS